MIRDGSEMKAAISKWRRSVCHDKEAFDEIKKMAPTMKVVFVSGYDDDNAHLVAIREEGYTTIQKPLKSIALLQAIRAELDKSV